MAYIATPSHDGAEIRGWPGKWVMERYQLSHASKKAVVSVDTGLSVAEPVVVDMLPVAKSNRLGKRDPKRGVGGAHAQNRGLRPRPVTIDGVRDYTGRLPQ